MVGCDTFVLNNEHRVLLIKRADSDLWALPGGFHDLGETPVKCAARECAEETGLEIIITRLLGIFSSNNYKYVHYRWKDNEIVHILFAGELMGGEEKTSIETKEIGWFPESGLPKLFDGHTERIAVAFRMMKNPNLAAHFE